MPGPPRNSPSVTITIDVAHPPLPAERVEEILQEAWASIRNSPTSRVLKVIHGYGSSGKGGTTREVVRNWVYRHRNRFRQVVNGEDCHPLSLEVQELRLETGDDPDLRSPNPGITIIWVK